MKLYTADRETGTFIDTVGSIEEGYKLIRKYEDADKEDGTYERDFYNVVDENHCNVRYTVFWVGGDKDGEGLCYFGDLMDAMNFARNFEKEHEEEFDPVCGGVAIADESGNLVEW